MFLDLRARLRFITYILVLLLGVAITMLSALLYAHRNDFRCAATPSTHTVLCPQCEKPILITVCK